LRPGQRGPLNDILKLARILEDIRFHGQTRIGFESAVWLMRTASYAILTRHEAPAPDQRQMQFDLRGGKWRPRKVTIDVS
jgi:hypothetical protein